MHSGATNVQTFPRGEVWWREPGKPRWVADILARLGMCQYRLQQYSEAEPVWKECILILKEAAPEGDRMLEMALMTLSRLEGEVPDEVFRELIANPEADDEIFELSGYFAIRV